MRSRAPPVADAARRSTRSGRKNRASEQREDFFGHRKADGADAPAATLGAYLCAVRTMLCIVRIQHCKRLKGVRQGGIRPPCPCFASFCRNKRKASAASGTDCHPSVTSRRRQATTNYPPAGQAYRLRLCKRLRAAARRLQTIPKINLYSL